MRKNVDKQPEPEHAMLYSTVMNVRVKTLNSSSYPCR